MGKFCYLLDTIEFGADEASRARVVCINQAWRIILNFDSKRCFFKGESVQCVMMYGGETGEHVRNLGKVCVQFLYIIFAMYCTD